MSTTNLRTIKTIRSFAADKEVFIRDISHLATPEQHCHLCGGEMAVEFIISQPALMVEAPYVVSIAVFVCTREACATPRAFRWIETAAGTMSVPDVDLADRIFNQVMDEWQREAEHREEAVESSSDTD